MNQSRQTGKRIVRKGEYVERLTKIVFGEKAESETERVPRRIVSKREYIRLQGLRMRHALLATSFLTIGGLCICVCVVSAFMLAFCLYCKEPFGPLLLFFLPGTGIAFFLRRGFAAARQVQKIDPGIPLTRANTGHLPASDSLVRASEESKQEQQAVLLRAASQSQETPVEQLVRAIEGQE